VKNGMRAWCDFAKQKCLEHQENGWEMVGKWLENGWINHD